MFHPNLGRWMTNDPKGFATGDVNLYRGNEKSPMNVLDPLGLDGDRASVNIKDTANGRLTTDVGNLKLSQIPESLDVHSNVDIRWKTYRGSGATRTLASAGQYIVWLQGREIVEKLRTSSMSINFSPLHGGHSWRGDEPPIPLPRYPNLKDREAYQKCIQDCLDSRGTSGQIQIFVHVKRFQAVQNQEYSPPISEPPGPTEFTDDFNFLSRPQDRQ